MQTGSIGFVSVPSAAIALSFALTHPSLSAQAPVTWSQVANSGPAARSGHAMAYDSQRAATVLFGGADASAYFDGTWEWDGTAWTQVVSAGPAARRDFAMVYDSQRGKTVLFGGLFDFFSYGDTWEWDGSSWTQAASSGPSARCKHAMAYDSQRGRTVLFGGWNGNTPSLGNLGDTWEWDGSTWVQVSTGGPAPRSGHAMGYDSQRGETVLAGGRLGTVYLGDTWEWDGAIWTQESVVGLPPRSAHAMAYDSQRAKTVLVGGESGSSLGDTWEWDGTAWVQASGAQPSGRAGHALVYDPHRASSVLFGGTGFFGSSLPDTWELCVYAAFTNYGVGCPGSVSTTSPCAIQNAAGGTLTNALAPQEFGILMSVAAMQIESLDIFTRSTGGVQVVPAHIYVGLQGTPLASTTITVGPTPGFYTATFATPVPVSGAVMFAIDVSSQTVVVPTLTSGFTSTVFSRTPVTGNWVYSPATNRPAWRIDCVGGTQYLTPALGNVGVPVIGTSYDVTLSDALPLAGAIAMIGLSNTMYAGTPLPSPLPNAPGCELLAAPDATSFVFTSAIGTAVISNSVPNSTSYIGIEMFHQWSVFDPVNPLGLVVSDAGRATFGT